MDKTIITDVRNISTENGLPFNFILAILEDREGNMWFATRGGVGCLKSTRTATYSVEHGLNNNLIVTLLQDSKGVLWLGTGNGLNTVSFKNVSGQNKHISKRLTKKDGLISNSINGLMIDHSGKLWITTPEGLSILGLHDSSTRNVSNRNGFLTNALFTSIEASNGTVWIAHSLK
jgi:ligand-binding sensor domain-containing protein